MSLGSIVRKLVAGIVLAIAPTSQYAPLMRTPDVYAQEVAKTSDSLKTDGDTEWPVLKKNRITFEQAKKGSDATKLKYLDQLLVEEFGIVYDKKRNVDGIINDWFYWQDKTHQKKACDRITADIVRYEGRTEKEAKAYTNELPDILKDIRAHPRCRDPPGQKKRMSYVILGGSLFDLTSEDEVYSVLDRVREHLRGYENNLLINGKPLDGANPYIHKCEYFYINLKARCAQMARILRGTRKTSAGFRQDALSQYETAYSLLAKESASSRNRLTFKLDGIEYTDARAKDAYDMAQTLLEAINDSMRLLGYAHQCVDERRHEYKLVRISDKKDEQKK